MTEFRDKLALRDCCEEEGRQARAAGLKQYENPYSAVDHHEQRAAWANGWWGDNKEEDAPIFIPLCKTFKPIGAINPKNLGRSDNDKKVA